MAMKICPKCGEKFSDTYKKCPFCAEKEALEKGKRLQKRPTKNGGRRAGTTDRENALTLILLVIMLVLAGILLWLLFGGGSDDTVDPDPSSEVSSGTETPDPGTTTPGTTEPSTGGNTGEMPGVEIDPPKPLDPTADEIKQLPQTLKLNNEDYTTNVGDAPVKLKVGDGSGVYTWVSADPAIASVDSTGKVTAIANGTVKVYATDGVGMGVCIVRVKGGSAPASGGSTGTGTGSSTGSSTGTTTTEPSAANAKINKTDITLAVGELFPLKITGYSGTVTWSVGDSSIASINTDGTVKGLKSGRTTVTAKVGDRTLSCIIRVKNG